MARLISYPTISTVASGDLFPVTDISDASKPLKNITAVNLQTFVNDGATLQRVISTGNTYQASPSDALWTWGIGAITATSTSFTSLLSGKRFKTTFIDNGSYTDVLPNQLIFNNASGNQTSITSNTWLSSNIDLQWPLSSGTLALTTDIVDSPWDTVTGGINYANGNVGIGTTTPSAKLDVNGDALINGLTVGQGAGTSTFGNTVFGKTALNNITTGLRNVAIGNEALLDNTTGNYNVAIGYQSLENNLANNNVAIGVQALERFEKADQGNNTAVGRYALGLVGGSGSGSTSDTGKNNTAIGYGAGYNRVGGTNGNSIDSVFIGSLTTSNGVNSENEIVIGTDAISAGSNTVVLGNDLITSTRLKGDVIIANGNVGIGTTSPSQKLQVGGNILATGNITAYGGASDSSVLSALGTLQLRNSGNTNVNIQSTGNSYFNGGNVGIGTTSPSTILDINGGSANGVNIQAANVGTEYVLNAKTSNGTSRLWVGGAGNVGIGTTNPSQKLQVEGTTYSTNGYKLSDGFSVSALGSNSAIRFNGGNILVNNSLGSEFVRFDAVNERVGIGTTSPAAPLEVIDKSFSTPAIRITALGSGEQAELQLNRVSNNRAAQITHALNASDEWYSGILRDGGNATTGYSISTEADINVTSPQFHILASGNVGIGTTNPRAKLEVGGFGSLGATTNKIVSTIIDGGYSTTNQLQYNTQALIGTSIGSLTDIFTNTGSETKKNFYVGIISDNDYFNSPRWSVVNNGAERLVVDQSTGNVGIGTTSPASKLEVDGGDIEVDDSASGLILRSPDGTRYRITVANGGTLAVTSV